MRHVAPVPGQGTGVSPRRRHVVATADAVVVPAPLARRVLDVLRVARLDGGVFTDTGGRTWTFLTTPVDGTRSEVLEYAERVGVRVVAHGMPLSAPPGVGPDDTSWWIQPPPRTGVVLPWQAVLATVWRVAEVPGTSQALAS
jgi:hypothetical protein